MSQDLWLSLKPHLRRARLALGIPSGGHPFKPNKLFRPKPHWAEVEAPTQAQAFAPAQEVLGGCRARCVSAQTQFVFAIRRNRPGDTVVINEVYCHDTYRLAEMTEAPRVVFDFGAHIGTFTVLVKQLFPNAQVYCFEPHPSSFALLQANTAQFSGVHLFNKALSYSEEAILIEADDCTGGNFVLSPEQAAALEGAEGNSGYHPLRRVETVSLETVFRETGVSSVDLVKWDCEGGEVDAFLHMTPETASRFGRMIGEYHVETGGIQQFYDIAGRRFPQHRFYGRDEDPRQNIGWFAADRLAA